MRMIIACYENICKDGVDRLDITSRSGVNIKYTYIILIKIEK